MRPVGVDLSFELLLDARRRCAGEDADDLFVRGDMRRLPVREGFDAAVSLFTSFGYFAREEEDRATLRSIARAVRPGGRYLLDFLNEEQVRSGLVPLSEETRGDIRIVQERRISPDGRRIDKTIRVFRGGKDTPERVFEESVRLYGRDDLAGLVEEAGFRVTGVLGSFEGESFSPDSPRLIVVARKPER
jgi:SAM-dependent methyltransferase